MNLFILKNDQCIWDFLYYYCCCCYYFYYYYIELRHCDWWVLHV